LTPYGRRRQAAAFGMELGVSTTVPWRLYVMLAFIALVLLFLVLHLLSGGPGHR
jgi:hypothetical protein